MARVSTSSLVSGKENQNRKMPKPLIERKRRARINRSLGELEKLLSDLICIESKNKKGGKVEKADILEIAVARMKQLHAQSSDSKCLFQQGFSRCLSEVTAFLENNAGNVSSDLVPRLSDHLAGRGSPVSCSVIRHTAELATGEPEVSSTVDSRSQSGEEDISSSTPESTGCLLEPAICLGVWRPWNHPSHSL